MPFLMSVVPSRITRTPPSCSTRARLGKASAAWETRYAGPVRLPGRTGVVAVAVPTFDAAGQLAGLASKVDCVHAFWRVVSRDGSWRGSCVKTERMLAWWAPCVTSTLRPAPFALETLELVDTLNDGLKGRAVQ